MALVPSTHLSRLAFRLQLLSLLSSLSLVPAVGFAQDDLRSTFPGRRVGGGTRGECSARLLVHLVPQSSVYAPSSTFQIGLLEGPTATPQPLELQFRPMSASSSNETSGLNRTSNDLPASTAGITLIRLESLNFPTVWESSYCCGDGETTSSDPLAFVQTSSPPAVSLLVSDSEPGDLRIQEALANLRMHCGGSVSSESFVNTFGLGDVIDSAWPVELPVRCPF
ncbi:hypothetical protein PMIT1323_01161 [Prochlorococcus marinus str. MIT 1323]|nr:hypothetical protein PMIT1323_01161 [Prochlorococcus marinus str. MIT 1323]